MDDETTPLILIIDDDPDLAAILELHVRRWGLASRSVGSAVELWSLLENSTPDAMLMDVMLGNDDGAQLIEKVKQDLPAMPVIMITRNDSVEKAVECMKHGAADYITKPLDFERVELAVRSALEVGRLASKVESAPAPRRESFHGIVGASAVMQQLFQRIENVAPADVSVLILGETGTGKELVARAIHGVSPRRRRPFVAVNAAAIPHELIESHLFGHERGAFTGAGQAHVGFCEQADGGTLFLDEIGEMSFDVQVKLLRFLQDHVVQRVGSRRARKVDVRVLAATNVDPREQISKHKLREDLYYRLRVVSLMLPPLRRRDGDVERLAEYFLRRAAERHSRDFRSLASAAEAALASYPWPGNVRELENVIEEAAVVYRGRVLTAEMLPAEIFQPVPGRAPSSDRTGLVTPAETIRAQPTPSSISSSALSPRDQAQKQAVVEALEQAEGRIEDAARALGMSRATIYRRIKKYGLSSLRS